MRAVKMILAGIVLAAAGGASAQSYDPAQQGPNAADFTYGYQVGGAFTAYAYPADFTASGCLNSANVSCLRGGPSDFLGAYFASQDTVANTAFLYAADVTLHPGANGELAVVQFVAPTAGTYSFDGYFHNVDTPAGNGVEYFTPIGSGSYAAGGSAAFSFTQALAAGQIAQFAIGNLGSYGYDTTGLRLTVTAGAVPEPASWALMIGGFGAVGATLRRRRVAALSPRIA